MADDVKQRAMAILAEMRGGGLPIVVQCEDCGVRGAKIATAGGELLTSRANRCKLVVLAMTPRTPINDS